MLHITKKIYPEGGQPRQMLNKLSPTIAADRFGAWVMQAVEFVLESIAAYLIIKSAVGLVMPEIGAVTDGFLMGISALLALAIQWQFTTSVKMAKRVQIDPVLAAKIGDTATTFTRSRTVIFAVALALNAVGGYILFTQATFKADRSSLEQLEKEFRAEKQRINDTYNAALASASTYDKEAEESRKSWKQYAKARPNEKAYSAAQQDKKASEMMATKGEIIKGAAQQKNREMQAAEAQYNAVRAELTAAAQADITKQSTQEWLALIGAILFSAALLFTVTILHSRVEKHEFLCGIRYEIQMPSNEEQSAVGSAFFVARFIGNALSQTLLVVVYSVAAWSLRLRFNFTGYGNTAIRREKIVFASQDAHQNAPIKPANTSVDKQHTSTPMQRQPIEFEVANDAEIPYDMTGSVAEKQRRANTQIPSQTVFANISANSENSSANSVFQDLDRAVQTGNSPRRRLASGAGRTDSDTMVEFRGQEYSLRTLKTMQNTYKNRALNAAFSDASRLENKQKSDELQQILAPYITPKEQA